MSPEQWKKVKTIVQEALARSASERTSYLDAACGSDASLRQEIESLLEFNKSGLLDRPAAEVLAGIEEATERTPARDNVPSDAEPDPRADSRFRSGNVLAERYRIVDWLGKGGMGEVYRAHDLKLDQDVALKFLPAGFQKDPSRRERFHREVRTARQVSHTNVCRVYDLGEIDGQLFLTMEYIDGEDLGSLLRRIGRLPPDKAVEIAQHLCFGLAAAHDKGVLHRDLKPANVMIDGQGVARITDFGLAAAAHEIEGAEIRVGTPAFMSPEQSSGKEVTVKSDLYSLGLVLYELFTGKRAFPATSPEELVRMRRDSTPTSPSSLVEGIDPAVERAIYRCLDVDPRGRPRSALAVAAALPGGDPLAAAMAAGETPSPQLVAESGKGGALRPAYAWAALLGTFTLLILLFPFMKSTNLNGLVALPRFPENLAERAREMLLDLGYPEPPLDATHGFSLHREYIQYLESKKSPHKFDALSTRYQGAVTFWYRQSPDYLVPHRLTPTSFFARYYDPPVSEPGGVLVRLDPLGRLRQLIAIPDETEVPSEPSWQRLFALAEFDPQDFSPAEPQGVPPVVNDRRAAWEGTEPESGLPVRIEAAAFEGRPVYFQMQWPWTPDEVSSNPWPRPSDVIRSGWGGWVHF